MLTPYRYPKQKVVRKQQPPVYTTHNPYKPFLRAEFRTQCVYCCRVDGDPADSNFHVEHYNPDRSLRTHYPNLFYACAACNRSKSAFWPDDAELAAGYFIPNPCAEVMFSHLQYDGHTVRAKTNAGTCALKVLRLNNKRQLARRSQIIQKLRRLDHLKTLVADRLAALISERPKASSARVAEIDSELALAEVARADIDALIEENLPKDP